MLEPTTFSECKQKTQTRFEAAKPGTLFKFLEEIIVVLDCASYYYTQGQGFRHIRKEGTVLMYIETIEHVWELYTKNISRMVWYEHRFLDLNGKVVSLGGILSTHTGLPLHIMEEIF
jgi:hypothetical protein